VGIYKSSKKFRAIIKNKTFEKNLDTFLTFYKRENIFKNFDFDFARYIHTNKNKKIS
jgi:hypothetical protein